MAVSVKTSGSQTATLTSEHTLVTVTDAGIYMLAVDTANLVADEIVTLRIYGKARTGDTERLQFVGTVSAHSSEKLLYGPPIVSPHYAKFTLEQNNGTGRVFPWAVYSTGA